MSKKSGKGNKHQKNEVNELDEFIQEDRGEGNSALEIGYLTGAILDYYETTGAPQIEDGDEWKAGTEYESKSRLNIPSELDIEIKKAFIFQIKKFQK